MHNAPIRMQDARGCKQLQQSTILQEVDTSLSLLMGNFYSRVHYLKAFSQGEKKIRRHPNPFSQQPTHR